jgi:hypothetical protein
MPGPAQAFQVAGITARTPQAAKDVQGSNSDVLLDVVILVDESGSETNADVARERQTAATIDQTLLNPASRVTVVGFGGRNGVAPNQNPVNVACQPTVASPAALSYLGTCVNSLHPRSEAEGDDTDYAAALGQAMSYFSPDTSFGQQSPHGATKVILFMTDGGLDVHRDPAYQPDWMVKAHAAVNQQLQAARQFGVQIWPLGFGSISTTDQDYLHYLAASGAQTACDSRQVSRPRANVVNSSADVGSAMAELYAAASCEVVVPKGPIPVGPGQSRSLYVTIPAIASDAAISVDKGGSGIQVSYYTPAGTQVTGTQLGGSTFQRSGQDTAVDVLRVTNPQAGSWQIKLTALPGQASELVTAYAFWQGAVRDVITANPSSAQTGEPITVTISVLSSTGVITDPATVAGLQVTASVSGDGVGSTGIRLSNAGHGAVAAEYTGTFTAPSTQGTLSFTGTAAGYGVYATVQPATVQVSNTANLFYGTVKFNAPGSVQRGQSVPGQVNFNNKTGRTETVSLLLSATPAGARITSPNAAVRVPPGVSTTSFAIAFPGDYPLGTAFLQLQVVDAASPHTSYASTPLIIPVTTPPGLLARFLWEFIAAAILIIAGLVYAESRRRKHRDDIDVRGLSAVLTREDSMVGTPVMAPSAKWSDTFRFVIRDEAGPDARLGMPDPDGDDPVYLVSRGRNGQVKVTPPAGKKFSVAANGAGKPLPNGLLLVFRDARPSAVRRRARHAPVPTPVTATGPRPDKPKPDDLW